MTRFVPLKDVASMVCTYSEGKWWLILNQPLHDPTQLFKVGICINGRNISVSMHTSLPEVGAEWTQYCWNPIGDFQREQYRSLASLNAGSTASSMSRPSPPAQQRQQRAPNTGAVRFPRPRAPAQARTYAAAAQAPTQSQSDDYTGIGSALEEIRQVQEALTRTVQGLAAQAQVTESAVFSHSSEGVLVNNVHALTGFMQAIQPMVVQLNNNVTTQGANIHSLVSEVQTLGTAVHQVAVTQTAQQSQTDQLTAISRQNADIIAKLAALVMSAGQPPPPINKCRPTALGVGVGEERGTPQEWGTWGRRAGRRR